MKKLLSFFIILSCIYICPSLKWNQSYCQVPQYDTKILYNYIYGELSKVSNDIELFAKTIVSNKNNFTKADIDDYSNRIDNLIQEISYVITDIQHQNNQYKNNSYILNGFCALNLMLSEYTFALGQLKEYLYATSPEENYNYLNYFFAVISQANSQLNATKQQIPK